MSTLIASLRPLKWMELLRQVSVGWRPDVCGFCYQKLLSWSAAEVQLWVPACLFYKHRFSIDIEWSIFPKTVQIHLIDFSTEEILLFFTTAYRDFSMGSFPTKLNSHQEIWALSWAVLYLNNMLYISIFEKLFILQIEKVIELRSMQTGYSFPVTSKHTLVIELMQSINISSFYPTLLFTKNTYNAL